MPDFHSAECTPEAAKREYELGGKRLHSGVGALPGSPRLPDFRNSQPRNPQLLSRSPKSSSINGRSAGRKKT
jgi:hypothetical protein